MFSKCRYVSNKQINTFSDWLHGRQSVCKAASIKLVVWTWPIYCQTMASICPPSSWCSRHHCNLPGMHLPSTYVYTHQILDVRDKVLGVRLSSNLCTVCELCTGVMRTSSTDICILTSYLHATWLYMVHSQTMFELKFPWDILSFIVHNQREVFLKKC